MPAETHFDANSPARDPSESQSAHGLIRVSLGLPCHDPWVTYLLVKQLRFDDFEPLAGDERLEILLREGPHAREPADQPGQLERVRTYQGFLLMHGVSETSNPSGKRSARIRSI